MWAATTDRHHKGAFVAAAIAGVLGISTLTLRSKAVPRMVSLAIVALGVGLAGYLKAKGVDFAFRDNLEYRFITYTLIMNLPVVVFARVLLSTRAAKRWCMTQAERSAVDELAASEERRVTEIAPASQPTDPPR